MITLKYEFVAGYLADGRLPVDGETAVVYIGEPHILWRQYQRWK